MSGHVQECVRALLLTPDGAVLLMSVARRRADRGLWITPGGRIEVGEEAQQALRRELREETGLGEIRVGPEIWIRRGTVELDGRQIAERERIFLVPTERFDPIAVRMEDEEQRRFKEFRWWRIDEIANSSEAFAPRRLGELLSDLRANGPPAKPIDTGA